MAFGGGTVLLKDGEIAPFTNNITGYFNLREVNDNLQQQNAMLQNEILNLQNRLKYYGI